MSHIPKLPPLLMFLFVFSGAAWGQASSSDLPEIGDSSSTTFSHEQAVQIDREMMNQLLHNGALLNDPVVSEYIQGMGHNLSSVAASSGSRFQFFVVKDNNINAFAMPGGHIGVNAGLILASETESELAAVLAHEISHVTQHHIARSVEKANQMNMPLTAALIAAILLGGSDPQVANAAFAATIGGMEQMHLDFSRIHEQEADTIGMQLLAHSDYDPRGMSNFFSRLQSETRYYGAGVPEFLRTHPVTTSRIAASQDRARQFGIHYREDSIHYLLIKARLRLAMAESIDTLEKAVQTEKPLKAKDQEARQYLLAIIYEKRDQIENARSILERLLREHPDRIAYIHALAQLEHRQKHYHRANELYQEGLRQYPGNSLLSISLAENHITAKEFSKARTLLQQILRQDSGMAEAYNQLAELEAASGNKAASHLARAEYYYLLGEPHSAINQLNTARKQKPLPQYFAARIDARLKQIQEEVELENKRSKM